MGTREIGSGTQGTSRVQKLSPALRRALDAVGEFEAKAAAFAAGPEFRPDCRPERRRAAAETAKSRGKRSRGPRHSDPR